LHGGVLRQEREREQSGAEDHQKFSHDLLVRILLRQGFDRAGELQSGALL
jgi:hypothetical protein